MLFAGGVVQCGMGRRTKRNETKETRSERKNEPRALQHLVSEGGFGVSSIESIVACPNLDGCEQHPVRRFIT